MTVIRDLANDEVLRGGLRLEPPRKNSQTLP